LPKTKKLVMIGIPTRGKLHFEIVTWLILMQKKSSMLDNPWRIQIMISKGTPQNVNVNNLVNTALKMSKFTHFLKIDDDLLPDEGLIDRLLKVNKDIVGAGVAIFKEDLHGLGIAVCNKEGKKYRFLPIKEKKIGRCDFVGGGIILVKRKVLETMKQPIWWIDPNSKGGYDKGSDERFCDIARELGFKVWYNCETIVSQHSDIVMGAAFDPKYGYAIMDVKKFEGQVDN